MSVLLPVTKRVSYRLPLDWSAHRAIPCPRNALAPSGKSLRNQRVHIKGRKKIAGLASVRPCHIHIELRRFFESSKRSTAVEGVIRVLAIIVRLDQSARGVADEDCFPRTAARNSNDGAIILGARHHGIVITQGNAIKQRTEQVLIEGFPSVCNSVLG